MARKSAAAKAAEAAADAAEAAADAAKAVAKEGADVGPDDESVDEAEQTVVDRIRAFTHGSDGERSYALLWRQVGNQEEEYLGQLELVDIAENPLEIIRDRHGGGKYRMRFAVRGGGWLPGTDRFVISGPPRLPPDPNAKPVEEKGGLSRDELELLLEKHTKGDAGLTTLLVEMMKQNGENLRVQMEQMSAPRTGTADILAAIAPLVVPLLEGLMAKNDTKDPLEQMAAMSEIMKNMREDSDPGMAGLVKSALPTLGKLVDATAAERAPGAQAAPPGPARPPDTGVPAVNPPAPPPEDRPIWYAYLAPTIPQFLAWAQAGNDPMVSGDFVADQLTDDQVGPIFEQLTRPEFPAELHKFFPGTLPHAEWFDAFLGQIVWQIDPNAEPEPGELATPAAAGEIVIE